MQFPFAHQSVLQMSSTRKRSSLGWLTDVCKCTHIKATFLLSSFCYIFCCRLILVLCIPTRMPWYYVRKRTGFKKKKGCIPLWKISYTVGICMLRYTVSSIRILRFLEDWKTVPQGWLHLNSISTVYFGRTLFDIFRPILSFLLSCIRSRKNITKLYTRRERHG